MATVRCLGGAVMHHRIVHRTGLLAKASLFTPTQPTDPLGPATNMAEPCQGLMLQRRRRWFLLAVRGSLARFAFADPIEIESSIFSEGDSRPDARLVVPREGRTLVQSSWPSNTGGVDAAKVQLP